MQKKKEKRYVMWAVCLAVLAVVCLLYGVSIAFFMGYGSMFFLIWGVMALVLGGLSLILSSDRLLMKIPSLMRKIFMFCCGAGILLFVCVEGMILGEFNAKGTPGADYVIVLGAQWKENGPSYVLQKRLDVAVTYLERNPDTMVIVSGGQGSNEHITEAAGMKSYLMQRGIREERILMEEKSTNTYENLVFSGQLLDRENDTVVLITNNFHMYRALQIARKQGYAHIEGLAAGSYPGMVPNNLLREFFGVVKDFLVGNM